MDKKKALKNILTAILFKVIVLIISLFSRRYLVNILGNEATGLYSLYISIIGFLAVAELGIGTAITFSMYKPIVEGDSDLVSGLYYLYKKVYSIIFFITLIIGLGVTPFLSFIIKEQTGAFNIYITYIIFLLGTLVTYLYGFKTSFIDAHLDKYVTTSILSIGKIIEAVLQIIVLLITKSFILFITSILMSNFIQMIATNIIFNFKYKHLVNDNKHIPKEVKSDVIEKTKAMFFHKIGGLLVLSTDSIIISAFIGISLLGVYSNYTLIMTSMVGILALIFSSIISIIGHSYAKNETSIFYKQFKYIYLVNYILGFVFFLGYYAIIDSIIDVLFGTDFIVNIVIVKAITINHFITFMRNSVNSFKEASGLFYQDRFKPLFEGLVNLVLSLVLVKFWGIIGVLVATIVTNLLITHIMEPYVLYKHGFAASPKKHYVINYLGILLFLITMLSFNYIPFKAFSSIYTTILVKGLVSISISISVLLIIYVISKTVRTLVNDLMKKMFNL